MSTSRYDDKRAFETTPEPPSEHVTGDVDPLTAPTGSEFVIQQHHATALHHDVRLEMMNESTPVLVSWAVPKGLPREKGQRHLAIRTEDHPMEYATFSGSIPGGEYGGGEVRIFDHGEYEVTARTDDRITFRLEGRRLAGVWHLIHTDTDDGKERWLALMSEDRRPPSDEMPDTDPMLATLNEDAFDGPEWAFEPKWDGVRVMAVCSDKTRIVSPNNGNVTMAYPELERIHQRVVALDAMLDGEIVAFEDGVPSAQRLQERIQPNDEGRIDERMAKVPIVYMVFDILYMDGRDLTGQPFDERRRALEEVIVPSEHFQVSPVTHGDGIALFHAATEQGFDGIVAKRLSSTYRPGKSSGDWTEIAINAGSR